MSHESSYESMIRQDKEIAVKDSACDFCGRKGYASGTGNYLDVMIGDAIYYICKICAKKIESELKRRKK